MFDNIMFFTPKPDIKLLLLQIAAKKDTIMNINYKYE